MNIGFDARLYRKGLGLGRYVEQLLVQYDQMNLFPHTLTVFLSEEGMKEFIPKNPQIKTIYAPFRWYSWQEQLLLPRLLLQYKLDIVHFPHFNVPIFYRRPFVVTIHDLILLKMSRSARHAATTRFPLLYEFKYLIYKYVLRHAVRASRHIITPTDYVKNDLITTFQCLPQKITRVYEAAMGVHPTMSSHTVPESGPYVFYVGNAYPHKNMELLLDLARLWKKESSDMHIVIVGQNDFFADQLQKRIQSEDLTSYIRHRGFVPEQTLSELYRNAVAYVFPSYEEGFGLPGLEAMSNKLPVISSSASCLPEVYGDAALYVAPDQPQQWLETINTVRYDMVLRNTLIEKGLSRVKEFDWSKAAQDTWNILLSSL